MKDGNKTVSVRERKPSKTIGKTTRSEIYSGRISRKVG
jgi:hypothetical protein